VKKWRSNVATHVKGGVVIQPLIFIQPYPMSSTDEQDFVHPSIAYNVFIDVIARFASPMDGWLQGLVIAALSSADTVGEAVFIGYVAILIRKKLLQVGKW